MAERYRNFINGKWVADGSQGSFKNINPADTSEVVGEFPASGKEEVEAAVAAARQAYKKWRLVPAPKRAEIIKRAGDLLVERKEEIAQLMTREMGKVIAETRGDVQEGIDTAYYAAGEGRRMFGDTVPCELPNKFGCSVRMPIGVCGMITPWNFPMAIPSWKILPALLCGNSVIFKPASDTPATAVKFVEVLLDAGVPPGCLNLVHGRGTKVGIPMVEHPQVDLIAFTGSSEVGSDISQRCGRLLKKHSLELGGKNAQIVMDDAKLDLALEGALWGAFGTTGQRCTATSRVILHRKIAREFTERFVEAAKKLKIGNGLDESVQVGPLINEGQRESVHSYIKVGTDEGAKLLCGGDYLRGGAYDKGFFYQCTVFGGVTPDMRVAQEEIFGPVVVLIEADSLEHAIDILNNSRYGLSSSIYTQDVNAAFQAMRDMEAGISYINGPTIGAEIQLPFGGIKDTGNGHRESSHTVLDIFTEWKTIYVDFSGTLQRAQIDTDKVSKVD